MNPPDARNTLIAGPSEGDTDEERRLSRRSFVRFGTVAGLGTLLALTACGNGGDDDDDEDDEDEDD